MDYPKAKLTGILEFYFSILVNPKYEEINNAIDLFF
jgi:hypothetical protein